MKHPFLCVGDSEERGAKGVVLEGVRVRVSPRDRFGAVLRATQTCAPPRVVAALLPLLAFAWVRRPVRVSAAGAPDPETTSQLHDSPVWNCSLLFWRACFLVFQHFVFVETVRRFVLFAENVFVSKEEFLCTRPSDG